MTQALVFAGARTPFGRFGGALREQTSPLLAAHLLRELLRHHGLDPQSVAEVVLGSALAVQPIVAREATLRAGLPPDTPSLTIDRACCSGMTAVSELARRVRAGETTLGVAGGVDVMSSTPLLLPNRWGPRLGHVTAVDPLLLVDPTSGRPAAVDASQVALEVGVDRDEQDAWALRSQQRYATALDRGFFTTEIIPVPVEGGWLDHDEQPRPLTTLPALAALPTVFGSPTVTAGNAPGMNDGATMLLVGAPGGLPGVDPLARIVATAAVAGPSREIATIPAKAIQAVLAAAGWQLDQVELFEVNEAFAAVPPATMRVLARTDAERAALLERTNVNGGAVAVGHPVGASGARLVLTLARALHERGLRRGVAAICGGAGQGDAIAVEVV